MSEVLYFAFTLQWRVS